MQSLHGQDTTCIHEAKETRFSWKWRTIKNRTWNFQKTASTDLETCSNKRLFLSFQIKCIRRGRATRLILWCNPLLFPERPRNTPDREDIKRFRWSHCLTRLYNNEVQSQLKNRWAWDSSSHYIKHKLSQ